MAQIAGKLPSEAKPRMVNCDLGHSFFMAKGRIRVFCGSGEKPSTIFTIVATVQKKNFIIKVLISAKRLLEKKGL